MKHNFMREHKVLRGGSSLYQLKSHFIGRPIWNLGSRNIRIGGSIR